VVVGVKGEHFVAYFGGCGTRRVGWQESGSSDQREKQQFKVGNYFNRFWGLCSYSTSANITRMP
jgi:hypothetical protein